MSLRVESVCLGPFETNAYLLTAEGSSECALVDAPKGAAGELLDEIRSRGLRLAQLLLTHGHWDHMCDAAAIKEATGCQVLAHRDDQLMVEEIERVRPRYQAMIPWLGDADFRGCKVDRWLADGDTVEVMGRRFEARHVPGHCPGSLLFHSPEDKLALVGDAIFRGSVGRTDLPGGDWNTLLRSIRTRIYTLPPDTHLLPGHGDPTTVAEEMRSNPYAKPA
ncbi:MAG: MBL fold metallo-hydrolase [Opitutia bacterium]|jgi:glyoxylase-like metal-dependent hydrolase (beta-lactamase superfamily II)